MNTRLFVLTAAACAVVVPAVIVATTDQDLTDGPAVQDAFVNFGHPVHPQSPAPDLHILDPNDVTIFKGGTVKGSRVLLTLGLVANGAAQPVDTVVQFGPPHPQPPAAPAGSGLEPLQHRLLPDEVTILKGGTVLFIMNGGGHRVAIYEVSKDTTRADIAMDLCQGGVDFCNTDLGTATQNLQYLITDGKGNLIIDTQTQVEQPFLNYLPGQLVSAAGIVLAGTTATGGAGHQIRYRFEKTGRYLVICATRGHSLNDWMFGFVDVIGN
jgi:plastocyanin